jgi:hypothetical protein
MEKITKLSPGDIFRCGFESHFCNRKACIFLVVEKESGWRGSIFFLPLYKFKRKDCWADHCSRRGSARPGLFSMQNNCEVERTAEIIP